MPKTPKKNSNNYLVLNWKTLVTNQKDAKKLLISYKKLGRSVYKNIIVCAPSPFLFLVSEYGLTSSSQSVSPEHSGATTGLVSAEILKSLKVSHTLLGHSEERARGLSDKDLVDQIKRSLEQQLKPIICFGESSRQHDDYHLEIRKQIEVIISGIEKKLVSELVLAYEPLWAIGAAAKRPANLDEIEEIAIYVKKIFNDLDLKDARPKFLYGGSVNETNAAEFMNSHHIDGLLMGRVSTDVTSFNKLVSNLDY